MSPSQSDSDGMKLTLISLHGLIRGTEPELGRDADTGGQVKYVLELARELANQPNVERVDLLTRQIIDDRVGPSYAKMEEWLCDRARIVRIPFGPKRYLSKESLWPYIEMFIDQTCNFFRREGLPDLIHGHYADAGLAGAQLARLLHLPFVFTGHSLGRVKRERLTANNQDAQSLEKNYKFSMRIEAEEIALETASMVVASTNQEVEQQYELYEHYVPDRMEVIPPGVDLSSFKVAESFDEPVPIENVLSRFLTDMDKPIILAMARPDERKNLEMLVKVYGESEELQRVANLVLILGTRRILRELPPPQRKVIQNIIQLIDDYDLYGKVAYPKTHTSTDVINLYQLTMQRRGVFINPAMTEPFGLTLLEAGACGLPVVATNDGGPRDILANCGHGILIDPFDPEDIRHALLRAVTNHKEWSDWSRQGSKGVHQHYSWTRHAERYLRDVREIIEESAKPALANPRAKRRIPTFDRLIITDLDNTLTGDDAGLREFAEILRGAENVGFGIATGRRLDDAQRMVEELELPMPDLFSTAVGTELHYGPKLAPDRSWSKQVAFHWDSRKVHDVLDDVKGLYLQKEHEQTAYKVSYEMDPSIAPNPTEIRRMLREAGLRVRVIVSLGAYLDVIPVRGGSDLSMRHLLYKWGFAPEQVLVAGDSGNDEGMLKGRTLGVVVGNYSSELEKLRNWPRIYFAEQPHARGIIEGIDYYKFLEHTVIPNDRVES